MAMMMMMIMGAMMMMILIKQIILWSEELLLGARDQSMMLDQAPVPLCLYHQQQYWYLNIANNIYIFKWTIVRIHPSIQKVKTYKDTLQWIEVAIVASQNSNDRHLLLPEYGRTVEVIGSQSANDKCHKSKHKHLKLQSFKAFELFHPHTYCFLS